MFWRIYLEVGCSQLWGSVLEIYPKKPHASPESKNSASNLTFFFPLIKTMSERKKKDYMKQLKFLHQKKKKSKSREIHVDNVMGKCYVFIMVCTIYIWHSCLSSSGKVT